jgi:hypothetical protein
MKAILFGLTEFGLVWLGSYYALYTQWFLGKFEPPGDFYGALFGGFLVAGAWGLVHNGAMLLSRLTLLGRAKRGTAPRDGRLLAVSGRAVAIDDPLIAPFSGSPCIVFGYTVERTRVVTRGTGSERHYGRIRAVSVRHREPAWPNENPRVSDSR